MKGNGRARAASAAAAIRSTANGKDGATDQLKESVLGRVVFDRSSEFDSRTDSIVRMEDPRAGDCRNTTKSMAGTTLWPSNSSQEAMFRFSRIPWNNRGRVPCPKHSH